MAEFFAEWPSWVRLALAGSVLGLTWWLCLQAIVSVASPGNVDD